MPVWRTRPVEEQGSLTLISWQVVQLPDGDRHLVGYCIENREGRVSSVVRKVDFQKLQFKTDSGRTYVLKGRPGGNLDAEYVWQHWAAANSVSSWDDVTATVWQQHRDAQAK